MDACSQPNIATRTWNIFMLILTLPGCWTLKLCAEGQHCHIANKQGWIKKLGMVGLKFDKGTLATHQILWTVKRDTLIKCQRLFSLSKYRVSYCMVPGLCTIQAVHNRSLLVSAALTRGHVTQCCLWRGGKSLLTGRLTGPEKRQGSYDWAHRRQGSHTRAHLAVGSHDLIPWISLGISNPAAADAGCQYLPGGRGLPHSPANQASHPGRPLIIICRSVTFAGHFACNTNSFVRNLRTILVS